MYSVGGDPKYPSLEELIGGCGVLVFLPCRKHAFALISISISQSFVGSSKNANTHACLSALSAFPRPCTSTCAPPRLLGRWDWKML